MANYVLSDIHGHYKQWLDFLKQQKISKKDSIYVVGDVLDRGPEGIGLLQDMMKRENVVIIQGNHEWMMVYIFEQLIQYDSQNQREIIEEELARGNIGQRETLEDFCKLHLKEQRSMIRYIYSLPLYLEIQVKKQQYLLVHGGLPNFTQGMEMEYYSDTQLLFGPYNFNEEHFKDKIVIVGHVPTRFIQGATPNRIFRIKDTIAMDCGMGAWREIRRIKSEYRRRNVLLKRSRSKDSVIYEPEFWDRASSQWR